MIDSTRFNLICFTTRRKLSGKISFVLLVIVLVVAASIALYFSFRPWFASPNYEIEKIEMYLLEARKFQKKLNAEGESGQSMLSYLSKSAISNYGSKSFITFDFCTTAYDIKDLTNKSNSDINILTDEIESTIKSGIRWRYVPAFQTDPPDLLPLKKWMWLQLSQAASAKQSEDYKTAFNSIILVAELTDSLYRASGLLHFSLACWASDLVYRIVVFLGADLEKNELELLQSKIYSFPDPRGSFISAYRNETFAVVDYLDKSSRNEVQTSSKLDKSNCYLWIVALGGSSKVFYRERNISAMLNIEDIKMLESGKGFNVKSDIERLRDQGIISVLNARSDYKHVFKKVDLEISRRKAVLEYLKKLQGAANVESELSITYDDGNVIRGSDGKYCVVKNDS